ncbi:GNAT family N-acetyltransferase [Kribbella sp. NPDC059898]|uniref:GNAT family N-acetyltransferase n=1 Tax=Kribbella sp. NPDC059898 TaxID=3346995 RepID=UPI00365D8952
MAPRSDWRTPLPAGFHISAIDDRFSELSNLSNWSEVVAEIESCWRSVREFRRTGFGFVTHDAETVVCWCTAESVSDRKCGIGIETVAPYRDRGFATQTAARFLEQCAERGLVPFWDAWRANLPSVAVANKLGLQEAETYSVHVCETTGAQR